MSTPAPPGGSRADGNLAYSQTASEESSGTGSLRTREDYGDNVTGDATLKDATPASVDAGSVAYAYDRGSGHGRGSGKAEEEEEEEEEDGKEEDDDDDEEFGLIDDEKEETTEVRPVAKIETKHPKLPFRAIYCKQVRRWVATYDHYCTVIGTPIGELNHGRFWWFVFWQTLSISYGIGVVHSGFRNNVSSSDWFSWNGRALFTAILLEQSIPKSNGCSYC